MCKTVAFSLRVAKVVGLFTATFLSVISFAEEQPSEEVYFDLPRLRADKALIRVAKKTKRTLLFPYKDVKKLRVGPLRGRYSFEHALAILLDGTGMQISAKSVTKPNGEVPDMHNSKKAILPLLITMAATNGEVFGQTEAEVIEQNNLEELFVTVKAIRRTYQNAMEIKRDSTAIVDAISADEIGALPDLSVAETLERITGVTGDRFKGNASEISIRGMGPFLGFSTFNGRAVSSGAGNRSVAFTQFPSELVNGATVYKSQTADLLEGGSSGTIDLTTLRPIDFGKRQFQIEGKLSHNEIDAKIDGNDGLGHRLSLSFTDVFETDAGVLGFAIGYAGADAPVTEESYNASSNWRECYSDFWADGGSSNCEGNNSDDDAYLAALEAGDYYFIPNLSYLRQMESEETRDAVITSIQWQPTDNLDINFDAQWSDREYYEDRHDLYFDDGRRRISRWETTPTDALTDYTNETRLGSYGEYRVRGETYSGAGLNIEWAVNDNLTLDADLSISSTERRQTRIWTRWRSDRRWVRTQFQGEEDFPLYTIYPSRGDAEGDVNSLNLEETLNDFSFFDANSEIRNYVFEIDDEITSFALNGDYQLESGFFSNIEAGVHFSERTHFSHPDERVTNRNSEVSNEEIAAQCGIDFPLSDFGDEANSNLSSWATYDTRCAYSLMLGNREDFVDLTDPNSGIIDLTEEVASVFAMTNFSFTVSDVPVSGNFGVRVVKTDTSSAAVRQRFIGTSEPVADAEPGGPQSNFEIEPEAGAEPSRTTLSNSYTNVLPSLNLTADFNDQWQGRFAAFKSLSRPDMWYLGAARTFQNDDADNDTLGGAVQNGTLSATGNPFLEALESDNFDITFSWFPNADTGISLAYYSKRFGAQYVIDGSGVATEPLTVLNNETGLEEVFDAVPVTGRVSVADDTATIQGVELTINHGFTNLPEPFDGLGIAGSFNVADSDFETPENHSNIRNSGDEILDFIEPANLPGLSDETGNVQLYWENYGVSARIAYKYRSEYLKPFGNNLSQSNRFVADTSSWDFNLSYEVLKGLKVKLQILNLTNEPYVEQRVVRDNFSRIEYNGRKVFLGFQYKI